MGDSTLRGRKAVFIRPSLSCNPFRWLGKGSQAGATKSVSSKILTQAVRNPYRNGVFNSIVTGAGSQSSNGTVVPLTVKESVGDYLYGVNGAFWDIDIRTQCGYTLDPNSWDQIKRICYAIVQDDGVDQESSYSPAGEGEVLITANMASSHPYVMIYGVESREYNLSDLYNLSTHFYFGSEDLWPHIDTRYGDEWVISIGNVTSYGVMWGSDLLLMELGRLNMSNPITALSAADRVVLCVDSFGDVWISHDNGNNFILQHDYSLLGVGAFRSVLVESYASVWLATALGELYRSSDGGMTLGQQIDIYSTAYADILDMTKSWPDDVLYLADNSEMGVSASDEDVIQRIFQSVTYQVSQPPNILHSDGILFIGGKDESDQPVLKMSLNGGRDWLYSFRMLGYQVISDDLVVVMPASGGCGVVWLVVLYEEVVEYLAPNTIHCDIYRSVYFGLPGTWKLEWSQETSLAGLTAYGFKPTDIAAIGVNSCVVVGQWLDWLDSLTAPELYAVELFSSEERDD